VRLHSERHPGFKVCAFTFNVYRYDPEMTRREQLAANLARVKQEARAAVSASVVGAVYTLTPVVP
jgi:hypothetical protein